MVLLLVSSGGCARAAFWLAYSHNSWILDWTLCTLFSIRIEMAILLDPLRLTFSATVLIITSAVFIFSRSYIEQEKYFLRFHLLVLAFVLSMLTLIFRPNLLSLLLGWDGLGVTSYLLVIYFQNRKSYNAGALTAFTNRIGDILIIFALTLAVLAGRWKFTLTRMDISHYKYLGLIVLIAGRTKRAQVPFSAWLPAAMAAPTPVSSLVHSSTLVTAGVYLLIRFRDTFYHTNLLSYLLILGRLTAILAGIRALWETDIKKIVALSTLSQLGLMFFTLGMGNYLASFIHLLSHAFFKALLFITIGQIIHLSRDYQDLRKIQILHSLFPISIAFSLVANLRLCGVSFLAGFYSKDFIYETLLCQSFSIGVSFIFIIMVALTTIYTFRLIFIVFLGPTLIASSITGHENCVFINISITILWPLAISGGRILLWFFLPLPSLLLIPIELKNLLLFLFLFLVFIQLFFSIQQMSFFSNYLFWRWGTIWNLPFISTVSSNFFSLTQRALLRKIDQSWLYGVTISPIKDLTLISAAGTFSQLPIYRVLSLFVLRILIFIFLYLCILILFNT